MRGRSLGKLIATTLMMNPGREVRSDIGKRTMITRVERGKGVPANQTGKLMILKQAQGKRALKMTQIAKIERENLPMKRR